MQIAKASAVRRRLLICLLESISRILLSIIIYLAPRLLSESSGTHQSCPLQVAARLSALSLSKDQSLENLGTLNFVTASSGQNWRAALHRSKDLAVSPGLNRFVSVRTSWIAPDGYYPLLFPSPILVKGLCSDFPPRPF